MFLVCSYSKVIVAIFNISNFGKQEHDDALISFFGFSYSAL